MKKLTKKNNKGFSLVELIVVVLIMAIIAVALAPQVTKWVENSRIAKDRQTKDSIVDALQIASTNPKVYGNAITVKSSGKTLTITADSDPKSVVVGILDIEKLSLKSDGTSIDITLSAAGAITDNSTFRNSDDLK